jgi:hypothetical protein
MLKPALTTTAEKPDLAQYAINSVPAAQTTKVEPEEQASLGAESLKSEEKQGANPAKTNPFAKKGATDLAKKTTSQDIFKDLSAAGAKRTNVSSTIN